MFKQTLLILFSAALTVALIFALSLSVTPGQAGNTHADTISVIAESARPDAQSAAPAAKPEDAAHPAGSGAEENSAADSPIVLVVVGMVCALFGLMALTPLFLADRQNGVSDVSDF